MPELPDIEAYLAALRPRIVGEDIVALRIRSISILKSYDPPPEALAGRTVLDLRRLGKRIVFDLSDDLHVIIHLMIAGRFQWRDQPEAPIPGKIGQAAFDFPSGTLLVTEAGTKKRASITIVAGEQAVAAADRGGAEVTAITLDEFASRLRAGRHTLKRALTDPTKFSGIGGAYGDEIMHRAQLSPLIRTDRLDDEAIARLLQAARTVLSEWEERLVSEAEEAFPTKVTAFRPEMAVHGKFGEPCPVCGAPVQRIRYAANETNYCPGCQTGGKILADRAMSRLLKEDWPRSLDDLE